MKRYLLLVIVALVAASGLLLPLVLAQDAAPANPLESFTRAWRDDPVWFDGKAEIAEYEATRTIYGQPRQYTATFMTNKEHADPQTKTKSADGTGRGVFKFHAREDIPTQKYTYHYSTMVYVGTDDLKSLKLDMASMEDCGASFKQFVNHAPPGKPSELTWTQFSYFPGEGHREGAYEPPANLVFHDALPLVLRGYPFEEDRRGRFHPILILPDQTSTKHSPAEPMAASLLYAGLEELDLPYGKVQAHRIDFGPRLGEPYANPFAIANSKRASIWFAADPELQHVMVAYEGPDGIYRLKSLRREAYWVN